MISGHQQQAFAPVLPIRQECCRQLRQFLFCLLKFVRLSTIGNVSPSSLFRTALPVGRPQIGCISGRHRSSKKPSRATNLRNRLSLTSGKTAIRTGVHNLV
jgi:hypothetical protein